MSSGPRQIKKRDGRVVPFDLRKIVSAISKAFSATGEGDAYLAQELAEVVGLALSRRSDRTVPNIEEIQDLVERVLMETGYTRTAKAYILYRDKRAQIRDLVSVRNNESDSSTSPQVQGSRGESEEWSKGRIVAALMSEADLPRETAEEIASRVERKVFESGLRRLSTSLIRELVDNELFEMGLEAKRKRQAILGIPKYDLTQLLRTGLMEQEGVTRSSVQDPGTAAALWLLEKYALEEVLPPESAELHRQGSLHFSNLKQLHREFSVSCLFPEKLSPDPEAAAQTIAEELLQLLQSTSRYLVLEGIDRYWEHCSDSVQFEKALFSRLQLLRQGDTEVVFSVSNSWTPSRPWPVIRPAAYAEGSWVGPGLSRAQGEETKRIACGAMASINLPRLVYESGRWGDEKFFPALVKRLEIAFSGLQSILEFQKQVRLSRGRDLQFSRISYSISLEGLVEAVKFSREGSMDMDFARTIRTVASDFLRDLSLKHGVSLSLEELSLREAASRFAHLDYERYPQSRELFASETPVYHTAQG